MPVKDKELLVVKSNKLIEGRYKLTLGEQRVIILMTANIKPDDDDFKTYKLKVSDLMKLLDIKNKGTYADIAKITKQLMSKILEIKEPDGLLQIGWLSSAKYYNDQGLVDLRFDPGLRPYLLKLKEQFTGYHLTTVLRLSSVYSIRIYELLKQYKEIGRRTFKLEYLREILGIKNEYSRYNDFKKRVIIPAFKELPEKTDLRFDFQEIKRGRRIIEIEFHVSPNQGYKQPKLPLPEPEQEKEKQFKTTQDQTDQVKNAFTRLLDFGLNKTTAQAVLDQNTPEGINSTLDHITQVYLNLGKKPIKNLKAYIATCFGLPPGSMTGKPKIQIDKEKAEKEAEERWVRKADEQAKWEEEQALYRELSGKHEDYQDERAKEKIRELGIERKEMIREFKEYLFTHLPFTREVYNKKKLKDPFMSRMYKTYYRDKILSPEERDFKTFCDREGYTLIEEEDEGIKLVKK